VTRFIAWIRKEWHEQRQLLLALLAVVPLGVGAMFWILGERMSPELTWNVVVPSAMLLYVLCVATDVFAGERQRGTLALVQRLPHGLRTAFLVKFAFLLLGGVVLATWTLLVMTAAWWLDGNPAEAWRTFASVTDRQVLWVIPATPALIGWIAMVSIWLPRGGAAAGAAPMLLALLLLPLAGVFVRWPWYHTIGSVVVPVSVLVGVTGLAAAWISWRRGLRFGRSSWRALRFGLPVVLAVSVAAYGYEAVSLDRYLTLDRDDPGLSIDRAWLGRDAKLIYLQARRMVSPGASHRGSRDTPSRPFTLDLGSGAWTPLGGYGGDVLPWTDDPWERSYRSTCFPCRQVDRVLVAEHRAEVGHLLDAATGLPAAAAPVSMQREVWNHPGPRRDLWPRARLRDGWVVHRRTGKPGWWPTVIVDDALQEFGELPFGCRFEALDTTTVLVTERVELPQDRTSPTRTRWGYGDWTVRDPRTGTSTSARGVSKSPFRVVGLTAGVGLLCAPDSGRLERWDPRTGERTALPWEETVEEGLGTFILLGPADQDDLVLCLFRTLSDSDERPRRTSSCIVLVDRASGRVRRLDDWSAGDGTVWTDYVGQDDAGGVWLVEDRRRIVRLGPACGQREVVFP